MFPIHQHSMVFRKHYFYPNNEEGELYLELDSSASTKASSAFVFNNTTQQQLALETVHVQLLLLLIFISIQPTVPAARYFLKMMVDNGNSTVSVHLPQKSMISLTLPKFSNCYPFLCRLLLLPVPRLLDNNNYHLVLTGASESGSELLAASRRTMTVSSISEVQRSRRAIIHLSSPVIGSERGSKPTLFAQTKN